MFINRETDSPLSDFCEFKVFFKKHDANMPRSEPDTYIIKRTDVQKMKDVFVELHYAPGINPHNGNTAALIYEIRVGYIFATGPFWWTTPGLQKNDDPNGVIVYRSDYGDVLWRHPDYQKILDDKD